MNLVIGLRFTSLKYVLFINYFWKRDNQLQTGQLRNVWMKTCIFNLDLPLYWNVENCILIWDKFQHISL